MLLVIRRWELLRTMRTLFLAMVLLIMLLLEINIEHLLTDGTFLDVPPTVAIMRGHLRLRKILEAIIAAFLGLAIHCYRNNLKIIQAVISTTGIIGFA